MLGLGVIAAAAWRTPVEAQAGTPPFTVGACVQIDGGTGDIVEILQVSGAWVRVAGVHRDRYGEVTKENLPNLPRWRNTATWRMALVHAPGTVCK